MNSELISTKRNDILPLQQNERIGQENVTLAIKKKVSFSSLSKAEWPSGFGDGLEIGDS